MSTYTFDSLSPIDFEELVRDLLQKRLGVPIESFRTGRDGGIDLRYAPSKDRSTIVQCKRYAPDKIANLISVLKRKEVSKISKLKPSRYILATSIPLSPGNKTSIFDILSPYCLTEGDIFGNDELNGMLRDYPEVLKNHYKLWLTSTALLERVLHASQYNFTAMDLDAKRREFAKFVPMEALPRARKLLDEHHYCIVTGLPGVGKTTLAHMIVAQYMDEGYEAIAISRGIEDGFPMVNEITTGDAHRPLVFYYDDFLGQTALEVQLGKNEDQRLIAFIESVKRNKNFRFILTTREYILNQALIQQEKLGRIKDTLVRCIVQISELSVSTKARILYNHLFFSDLPEDKLNELLRSEAYLALIRHKNYNPRLIEHICLSKNTSSFSPTEYVKHVLSVFENPRLVWEHPFRRQISEASQLLLLCLVTFVSVNLEKLEEAITYALGLKQKRLAQYEFKNIVDQLDGTFLKTNLKTDGKGSSGIVVELHNPSIRDFLEAELLAFPNLLKDQVKSAIQIIQIVILWNKLDANGDEMFVDSLKKHAKTELLDKLRDLFEPHIASLQKSSLPPQIQQALLTRFALWVEIVCEVDINRAEEIVAAFRIVVRSIVDSQTEGRFDSGTVTKLIMLMSEVAGNRVLTERVEGFMFAAAKGLVLRLSDHLETIEECSQLGQVLNQNVLRFSDEMIFEVREKLRSWLARDANEVLRESWSGDEFYDYRISVESCGEVLAFDVAESLEKLDSRIEEARRDEEEQSSGGLEDDRDWGHVSTTSADSDIKEMFQTILRR